MVLPVVDGDVDVADVPVLQRALVRDAVADHLIHAGAAALGELRNNRVKSVGMTIDGNLTW